MVHVIMKTIGSFEYVSIFKTANIGKVTFLLPFSRLETHEKSTKNEGFQSAVTQVALVKSCGIKSKYKFNFYFTFGSINIDNRSSRKLFFFTFLKDLLKACNDLKNKQQKYLK